MTLTVDNTAKVSGGFTALIAWVAGFAAPAGAATSAEVETLVRLIVAIIGGLFGLAGTALAVLLRHYLQNRKKDRD